MTGRILNFETPIPSEFLKLFPHKETGKGHKG